MNCQLRVMPETRAKLQAVADKKRWNLIVAIDEAVNAILEKEGIATPADTDNRPLRKKKVA